MPSPTPAGTPPVEKDLVPDFQSPVKAFHDLVHWLELHWLNVSIAIGAAVLIYFALGGAKTLCKRIARRHEGSALAVLIGRAAARTSHYFMMLVAARLVVRYASPPAWLNDTIHFLFTIVTVFQVAIWVREVVLGLIQHRSDSDVSHETLANAMGIIRVFVTVGIFAIAVVVVLDNVGVNVTGLVAGLGIGGIAIGLAAQGIFSQLFAALSIIFDRPFKRGEIITYDQTTARVDRIGLMSTRLMAVTGERKIISNANLLQKEITGLQHIARKRVIFKLGLVYHTSPDMAERVPDILREIVDWEQLIFIQAGFVGFGASSLDYEVAFDVPDPDHADYFMTRHRLGLAILRKFNEEGIEFAFPTQTTMTAAPDGRMIMPYADVHPEG